MPGFQTEFRAAIIDEIIFRIEPAVHQLRVFLILAKRIYPAFFDQRHIGR